MNRIALYLGTERASRGAMDLQAHFQDAKKSGLRIVTVMREAPGGAKRGRPIFKQLVARMEAGEFEAIVVEVDGGISPSEFPPPKVHGDTWLPYQSRRCRRS